MNQLPHPQAGVPFFDEAEVQRLLQPKALLPALERALIDFSAGRVVHPVRSIVSVPQHSGFMGLMPAVYGDIMGAKLVNLYPNNATRSGCPPILPSSCSFERIRDSLWPSWMVALSRNCARRRCRQWRPGCYHRLRPAGSRSLAAACRRAPTSRRSGWCDDSMKSGSGAAIRKMQSSWLTRLVAWRPRRKMQCATRT